VWLAEHHFTAFSVCPSVHVMAMAAAARTKRLRIGTAVSLAAFYHPLRLAEEVALVDLLSGGRVNWGAGRGFDRSEFENFGVAPDESVSRFRETVEIVLAAWTQERLTFEGEHFRYRDVEVLPKPLQKPHPPTWMAASSEPSVVGAAERGFSILMDPHSPHKEIARKQRLYAERLAAAGHDIEGRELPVARLLAVAPTREAARAVAERGVRWIIDSYADVKHRPVLPFGSLGARDGRGSRRNLSPRDGDPRLTGIRSRRDRAPARRDEPRVPAVRAAQPRELPPLHEPSTSAAQLALPLRTSA